MENTHREKIKCSDQSYIINRLIFRHIDFFRMKSNTWNRIEISTQENDELY